MLNFAKSGILSYSNPCISDIYQCTKFDESIFISERDMTKNPKFKMTAAAILNFANSGIFGYSYPRMANISVPNLTKMSSFMTEIWPKSEIHDGGHRHFDFLKRYNFGIQWPLYVKYLSVYQFWWKTKFGSNRYGNCWDMPVSVFPRWRLSAILDLFYPDFGPPTKFHLMD